MSEPHENRDMSQAERDQLIEEAAALPARHPRRQALLASIDAAGEDARREWVQRSEAYDAIRTRLNDVPPPRGMIERLMLIPDGAASTTPSNRRRVSGRDGARNIDGRLNAMRSVRGVRWLGAAAAIIVIAAAVLISIQLPSVGSDAFVELASRMAKDHAKQPELAIETADPNAVESHLNRVTTDAALHVRMPSLDDVFSSLNLKGGRLCAFDERPIAYTRWVDPIRDMPHSLYQVNGPVFDLPEAFDRRELVIDGHRVVFWQEAGATYAMVCEE